MRAKRIAIVTGGNRGIGLEIARQLMKSGVFVVVGCRSEPKCALAPPRSRAAAYFGELHEPGLGPNGHGRAGRAALQFFRDRKPIPW